MLEFCGGRRKWLDRQFFISFSKQRPEALGGVTEGNVVQVRVSGRRLRLSVAQQALARPI